MVVAHDSVRERLTFAHFGVEPPLWLPVDEVRVGGGSPSRSQGGRRRGSTGRTEPAPEQHGRSDAAQAAEDHREEKGAEFTQKGLRGVRLVWMHSKRVLRLVRGPPASNAC